jgi:hypothetical protein
MTNTKETSVTPILIGNWKEECNTSSSQKLCDNFGLVNIFDRLYPDHDQFKTYKLGSQCIDFALTTPELADQVTNIVYKLQTLCTNHSCTVLKATIEHSILILAN